MRIKSHEQSQFIFTSEGDCELAKADFQLSLSSAEMDEDTKTFSVTYDRLLFQNPLVAITTILEKHGFVINLENILSCFDQMKMSVKGYVVAKEQGEDSPKVKGFIPTLSFNLPKKSNKGFLLSKFYKEIEAYEAEIQRVQKEKVPDTKDAKEKEKLISRLNKSVSKLTSENEKLKIQTEDLANKLNQIKVSHKNIEKALQSGDVMPANIRLGVVKSISLIDRLITVRSGRKTLHVSTSYLTSIPVIGEQCLLLFEEGHINGAYFYQSKGEPFKYSTAQILAVENNQMKIRDSKRRTMVITAQSSEEEYILSTLKRGDEIMIQSVDGIIIRYDKFNKGKPMDYQMVIQEEIALEQIGSIDFSETKVIANGLEQSKKDEVA